MATTTRNVTVSINRSAGDVYKYASDPNNMSEWAAGLAHSPLTQDGSKWAANSPMGQITIDFTEPNEYGVFDHTVTLPSGETVLNAVRVIPDGFDTSDVVFTIRQRDMTDEQFDTDVQAVTKDLTTLKQILES